MRKLHNEWLLLAIIAMILSSGLTAFGQAVTGSIMGYITDPSGAAIPSASVTATEAQTNVATTRTTDSAGMYLITNLLPGAYTINVEAKGFKAFSRVGVRLDVGGTVRTDATLELGEVTQQISVEAHAL